MAFNLQTWMKKIQWQHGWSLFLYPPGGRCQKTSKPTLSCPHTRVSVNGAHHHPLLSVFTNSWPGQFCQESFAKSHIGSTCCLLKVRHGPQACSGHSWTKWLHLSTHKIDTSCQKIAWKSYGEHTLLCSVLFAQANNEGMPHVTPANPSQSDPVFPPISISTFLIFCYNSSTCQYALWLPALCTRLHRPFQVDLTSSEMQALLPLKETICALLLPRREGNKGAHLWTCAYRHQSFSFLSEEVSREKSNSHDLFRYSGIELYLDPDSANTFLGSSHFYSDCQGSWAGSVELNLDLRRISSKLNGTFKALSECWDCGNSLWSLRDYHIVSKEVARTPATFPDSEKRGSTNHWNRWFTLGIEGVGLGSWMPTK